METTAVPQTRRAIDWSVERVVRFPEGTDCGNGYSHLGFHDADGTQYAVLYDYGWVGAFDGADEFAWTAGVIRPRNSRIHVEADLKWPMCIARESSSSFIVTSHGNGKVFRVVPAEGTARLLVSGPELGIRNVGNCLVDAEGFIWINEVTGCRLWRFEPDGKAVLTIGDGSPGFSHDSVPLDRARFSWIYDIRLGSDDDVYVLDSRNYAVRRVDLRDGIVETVAGTGRPGYTGDGADAREATFGHDPSAKYDGPWSLSLDEEGNIFVGDTQNHVLRMVERGTNVIETIAGDPEAKPGERNAPRVGDPLALKLPQICSLDYFGGRLFVPDLSGDLVILQRRGA